MITEALRGIMNAVLVLVVSAPPIFTSISCPRVASAVSNCHHHRQHQDYNQI